VLRSQLHARLLPSVIVVILVASVFAYRLSLDMATDAYDAALFDAARSLAQQVKVSGGSKPTLELPRAAIPVRFYDTTVDGERVRASAYVIFAETLVKRRHLWERILITLVLPFVVDHRARRGARLVRGARGSRPAQRPRGRAGRCPATACPARCDRASRPSTT